MKRIFKNAAVLAMTLCVLLSAVPVHAAEAAETPAVREACAAYLELVRDSKDVILQFESELAPSRDASSGWNTISLEDVTGDGIPELFLTLPEAHRSGDPCDVQIQIWTYTGGTLRCIYLENAALGITTGGGYFFRVEGDPALYAVSGIAITLYDALCYRRLLPDPVTGNLVEVGRWAFDGSWNEVDGQFKYRYLQIDGTDVSLDRYRAEVGAILRGRTTVVLNVDWYRELGWDEPLSDQEFQRWTELEDSSMTYAEAVSLLQKMADETLTGVCGDGLTWRFSGADGTLTISGTGEMYDYGWDDPAPWCALEQSMNVVIEYGVTGIGNSAFANCSLTGISIPNSVTSIGGGAFYYCDGLTSLTIPDSVTSIGDSAFLYCSISDITIPGSVAYLGDDLFIDSNLMRVTILDGVKQIGSGTFDCTGLSSVKLPGSVTAIGSSAFSMCFLLRSVTIPAGVTSIGDHAFSYCTALKDVYYGGSEAQWNAVSVGEGNDELAGAAIHFNSDGPAVLLSPQKLTVDGRAVDCEKYNIDGSNYFKLRDIAFLLSGTGSRFSVGWDAASGTVIIRTGETYEPNGSELTVGTDKSASAEISTQFIMIDGEWRSDLSVYNLEGNNFFRLRDLGSALGFDVDYDPATNTAIIRSR